MPENMLQDFFNACRDGDIESFNKLIKFKVVRNCVATIDNRALRLASENGHLAVVNKLLKYETLPPYIGKSIINIIKKATHSNLNIRYSNASEFLNDLYKVQKRLTNWKEKDGVFYGSTIKGENFKILYSKNGFSTEKKGTSSWRRTGDFSSNIEKQFANFN